MEWEDICSGRGLLAAYDFFTRDAADSKVELEDAAAGRRPVGGGGGRCRGTGCTRSMGLTLWHTCLPHPLAREQWRLRHRRVTMRRQRTR